MVRMMMVNDGEEDGDEVDGGEDDGDEDDGDEDDDGGEDDGDEDYGGEDDGDEDDGSEDDDEDDGGEDDGGEDDGDEDDGDEDDGDEDEGENNVGYDDGGYDDGGNDDGGNDDGDRGENYGDDDNVDYGGDVILQVDEGGSKRFLQNMWTSFLKARLVCGIPNESLYFNRLQDVYVLHAEEWRDSQVYALFTSSWNGTAVCVYSMEEIDRIFQNSPFRGYSNDIPNPRPGT
ncbi:unnamed protein product, partial [Oncorhynchus mykiss]